MKKYILGIVSFFLLFSFSSCVNIFQNSITGDGNVVSEMREIPSFNAIKASAGLNVNVRFGEERSEIEVLADENLHEHIKTEVSNGVLKIYTRKNIRKARSKDIYVYAGDINELDVSSAAQIIGENILIADKLDIVASSAGKIGLELDCSYVEVNVSSSAAVLLAGRTKTFDAEASSAGEIHARDFQTEECKIGVSSAAKAEINVMQSLSADASSAGNIVFTGNPQERKINTSSAGRVLEN
jgi:Putative auto-transporter adhesin, head GIN domain